MKHRKILNALLLSLSIGTQSIVLATDSNDEWQTFLKEGFSIPPCLAFRP